MHEYATSDLRGFIAQPYFSVLGSWTDCNRDRSVPLRRAPARRAALFAAMPAGECRRILCALPRLTGEKRHEPLRHRIHRGFKVPGERRSQERPDVVAEIGISPLADLPSV